MTSLHRCVCLSAQNLSWATSFRRTGHLCATIRTARCSFHLVVGNPPQNSHFLTLTNTSPPTGGARLFHLPQMFNQPHLPPVKANCQCQSVKLQTSVVKRYSSLDFSSCTWTTPYWRLEVSLWVFLGTNQSLNLSIWMGFRPSLWPGLSRTKSRFF